MFSKRNRKKSNEHRHSNLDLFLTTIDVFRALCYFLSNTSIWLIVLCTVSIICSVQQRRFIIVYLIDFAIIISVNGYLSIFCRVFLCRHNRGGTFNNTFFPLMKPTILIHFFIVIDNEAHSMCSLFLSVSLCVWKLKLKRNHLELLESRFLGWIEKKAITQRQIDAHRKSYKQINSTSLNFAFARNYDFKQKWRWQKPPKIQRMLHFF